MKKPVFLALCLTPFLKIANAQVFFDEVPYTDSSGTLFHLVSEKRDRIRFYDVSKELGLCSDASYFCVINSFAFDISVPKNMPLKGYPKTWNHLNRCFSVVDAIQISPKEKYYYITGRKNCEDEKELDVSNTIYSNKRGIIYFGKKDIKGDLFKEYILAADKGVFHK